MYLPRLKNRTNKTLKQKASYAERRLKGKTKHFRYEMSFYEQWTYDTGKKADFGQLTISIYKTKPYKDIAPKTQVKLAFYEETNMKKLCKEQNKRFKNILKREEKELEL